MARTQGAGPQAAPLCALHSVLLQKVLLPARAALCTYSAFVSSFYTPLSKSENKGARSRKSPALFSRFVALKPTKQNKHTHILFSQNQDALREESLVFVRCCLNSHHRLSRQGGG
jgi:hypothetical protein